MLQLRLNYDINLFIISCMPYFVSQVNELKERMLGSGMPWPGDEGDKRWEQAWMAIKKVPSSTINTSN